MRINISNSAAFRLPATLLIVAVLAGCASGLTGSDYSGTTARQQQIVKMGTVESTRPVIITKEGGVPVGTLVGGALGALGGSRYGKGNEATALGIGGAVAGGLLGKQIDDRLNKVQGLEITVKLDGSGDLLAVTQDAGGETFNTGDRVRILVGPTGQARVTH